jgi:Family of unknown function (DUF5767)
MNSNPGGDLSSLRNFGSNAANIDDIISLDITDLGNNGTQSLDMSLLANQNKVPSSPKTPQPQVTATPHVSSGSTFQISNPPPAAPSIAEGIEFVNIEDTQKTFSVNSGGGGDTIHINRSSAGFASESLGDPSGGEQAPVSVARMSPEQEATEKTALLNKLRRLASKGIEGARMNMTNTLEEIKAEYARLVDSRNLESSIKFQRNALLTCVTGMEFLNQKFNPLDVNLDGWSESVNENQEDFDEIFEELYDKYKDRSKVAPEVRLVMTLGISAAMCHVTNTFFKSKMPGMDDILKKNPELARQFAQAAASHAVGPGFANFVSMGQGGQGRPQQQEPQGFQSQGGWTPEEVAPPPQTARREMKGPSGVEDILRAFEAEDRGPATVGFTPPPRADLDGSESIYTSTTMNGSEAVARKAGRGGKRKTAEKPAGSQIDLVV